MRKAPSVVYPVGPCFFYAAWLVALGVLGLVVWLWWSWSVVSGASSPRRVVAVALGAVLWLAWAVFAWRSWVHAPVGYLQWAASAASSHGLPRTGLWRWHRQVPGQDHHNPHLSHGAPLQQVQCVLDLQSRLLLRVRNPDGVHRWLWLERRSDPTRWMDLRRALVQTA
jgi:hypothetical protein